MTNQIFKLLRLTFILSIFLFIALVSTVALAQHDHAGHDHGHDEPAAVAVGAVNEVRSARIGDYEVVMKTPPLEPDKEIAAKIFLTWAQTNHPISSAIVTVIIERENDRIIEVNAEPDAKMAGGFTAKLPPIPQGEAKIKTRWQIGSTTETADFGTAKIETKTETSAFPLWNWLPNVLFVLVALAVLALIAAIIRFGVQQLKKSETTAEPRKDTVAV